MGQSWPEKMTLFLQKWIKHCRRDFIQLKNQKKIVCRAQLIKI